MQRWSSRESLALCSPVSYSQKNNINDNQQSSAPPTLKCVVDIKRRYIEIDDELVSIITDIEGKITKNDISLNNRTDLFFT